MGFWLGVLLAVSISTPSPCPCLGVPVPATLPSLTALQPGLPLRGQCCILATAFHRIGIPTNPACLGQLIPLSHVSLHCVPQGMAIPRVRTAEATVDGQSPAFPWALMYLRARRWWDQGWQAWGDCTTSLISWQHTDYCQGSSQVHMASCSVLPRPGSFLASRV